jgi:phosphoenolpyruvate mutase
MSPMSLYVELIANCVLPVHVHLIQQASKLGDVIVALPPDQSQGLTGRKSDLTFRDRKMIVESMRGVKQVIEKSPNPAENLRVLRPNYYVYGADGEDTVEASVMEEARALMAEWGGRALDAAELEKLSAGTDPSERVCEGEVLPEERCGWIRRRLNEGGFVRLLEAHNGLSAMVVEKAWVRVGDTVRAFDGIWGSSLTDSTARGRPDTAVVDLTTRMQTVSQILDVTTKPLVFDGDNGGTIEFFRFMVRSLERLTVSGVIIEDKIGIKRNSMFGAEAVQTQDDRYAFGLKIAEGKRAQAGNDFMVIARIESFISQAGLDDAILRAKTYIDSGADALMIHSKHKEVVEIASFCEAYRTFSHRVPLVVVPSTYDTTTEQELMDLGVNMVIYANHLLRSAYPAMVATAESILAHSRAGEASANCLSIADMIRLIPETG